MSIVSCETIVCDNVCDDCPAAIALGIREQELEDNSDKSNSESRLAMQKAELRAAAKALNDAAGEVVCKDLEKELPSIPDVMPAVGAQELIDYVSQCPSFQEYVQIRANE